MKKPHTICKFGKRNHKVEEAIEVWQCVVDDVCGNFMGFDKKKI